MAETQDNAQRGDRLTAASWRQSRADIARALRPVQVVENSGLTSRMSPAGQVIGIDIRQLRLRVPDSATMVKQFSIQSIADSDHLECKEILEEADTEAGGDTLAEDVTWLLKPWFLRGRFTWDKDFGDPLPSPRLGITYSAYSGTHQQRTATKDTGTERQTIVPGYVEADRIMAIKVALGRKRLGVPVVWLDLNVDGRMWQVTDGSV